MTNKDKAIDDLQRAITLGGVHVEKAIDRIIDLAQHDKNWANQGYDWRKDDKYKSRN